MDKSYLLVSVLVLIILINTYQVENFDLENINLFDKITFYSEEKYLNLKKSVSDIFNDRPKKKKQINNDCKHIKFDNYKIQSNNVISAYYGNTYYNFNDI
jgi:hypothetical protein